MSVLNTEVHILCQIYHNINFDLVPTCSFTTLTVIVEDVNDNIPVFSMSSYEFGKIAFLLSKELIHLSLFV